MRRGGQKRWKGNRLKVQNGEIFSCSNARAEKEEKSPIQAVSLTFLFSIVGGKTTLITSLHSFNFEGNFFSVAKHLDRIKGKDKVSLKSKIDFHEDFLRIIGAHCGVSLDLLVRQGVEILENLITFRNFPLINSNI